MHFLLQSSFELTGTFEGYARNEKGKLRMLLRVPDGEVLRLKVPKEIRKSFENRLKPGMELAARGVEKRSFFEPPKRSVSWLRLLSVVPAAAKPSACAKCPIRVCSKKNCWKSGGKELWAHLEKRIAEEGLEDVVELKAVGCLGNCKRAPNAVYSRELYGRCTKADADAMLADIAAKQRAAGAEVTAH